MNMYALFKKWVVSVVLAFLLFPAYVISGEFEAVSPDKNTYKLWLVSWGPQSFPSKGAALSAELAWVDPPKVVINILESAESGQKRLRWQYEVGPLGIGDDFVVQGEMYRITGIDTKYVKLIHPYKFVGWCMQESCAPFVSTTRLSRIVSPSGSNALILPQWINLPVGPKINSTASINSGMDECELALYLDGLAENKHEYKANIRSEMDAFYYQGDISKCHEKVRVGRVEASVGSILDFGDFGRFKVESIWPAEPHHQAWVVLVPEDKKPK